MCVCVPSTGFFFVCFRPHWRTNYACFMCDSEEGTHQCTQIRGVCCTPRREPACLMVPKICQGFPSVKKSATQRGLFVVALCSQRGLFLYRGGKFDVPNMAILSIISFRMDHPYLESHFAPLCHSQSFTK